MFPLPELTDFSIRQYGPVALLACNRPQSHNSANYSVLKSFCDAMQWASKNPEIKVIVQTGTGKFFNTGLDLSDNNGKFLASKMDTFREAMTILIKCKKPLIAAVNGPCIGYGATCLAHYDLVYSVPNAYFNTPFSKWGLCPEAGATLTFPAILGHQKAMSLLLAGDTMSAEEVHIAGLISKIIPAKTNDDFMIKVLEIAQRIASYPPQALEISKRLIGGDKTKELLEAVDKECNHIKVMLEGIETQEAISKFAKEQKEKNNRKERLGHRGPKL